MKTQNIFLIIFIILTVGIGWSFFAKEPSSTVVDYNHKDIYYCSIHPQVTIDKPGTCPICKLKE